MNDDAWRRDFRLTNWEIYAAAICTYFSERAFTIMKQTWSGDRVSLVFYFESLGFYELAALIRGIPFTGCYTRKKPPPEGLRTCAQIQKSISPDDLSMLVSHMTSKSRSKYGQFAADILSCTVFFGLRPCEWPKCWVTRDTPRGEWALVVENAKKGNKRTPGLTRTLYLTGIPSQDYMVLDRLLTALDAFDAEGGEKAISKAMRSSRSLLLATAKRLWPKRKRHPGFYSARHQLAANLKKALVPLKVIAALMGHATDATATHLYARANKGTLGGFIPRAEAQEVNCIREVWKIPAYIKKRPSQTPRFDREFQPGM